MTLDEFKAKLAEQHAGQFNLRYGCIRHKTLTNTVNRPACPLAAMFGDDYVHVADDAGMSDRDQRTIMAAADGYDNEIRGWMLETLCGETT